MEKYDVYDSIMIKIEQCLCSHDYERQSVYVDAGELVKKCRNCGKWVRENGDAPSRASA